MSQYGNAEYWEDRYARDPEPFDWYQRFSGLQHILSAHLAKTHRILNVGAGNSQLTEELLLQGYSNITSIDISSVCVKAMQERYSHHPLPPAYLLMDVRSMDFPACSFDVVVDKATLDSVLCGQNCIANGNKMISQVHRVLTKDGVYVGVSYGSPEYRLSYLERPEYGWSVTVQQVSKPPPPDPVQPASQTPCVHYVYVCRKGGVL